MLPLTKDAFEHPRVQANPVLAETIAAFADWDRFNAMSREELALRCGVLLGALMLAFEELDAAPEC
jgi:hypothetical protein